MLTQQGLGGWGLGFRVGGSSNNPFLSHEGSAVFQDDMLVYLHGNGFVVMTSGGGGGGLADELIRSAGTVYDFPDFRPMERTAVQVSPEILSQYPGTYGFVKVAMDGASSPPKFLPVRDRSYCLPSRQHISLFSTAHRNSSSTWRARR